jgi:hypothetical protein
MSTDKGKKGKNKSRHKRAMRKSRPCLSDLNQAGTSRFLELLLNRFSFKTSAHDGSNDIAIDLATSNLTSKFA